MKKKVLEFSSSPTKKGSSALGEQSSTRVSIDDFSDELLEQLFLNLDLLDLLQASRVCRRWRLIIKGDFPRYLEAIVVKLQTKNPEDTFLERIRREDGARKVLGLLLSPPASPTDVKLDTQHLQSLYPTPLPKVKKNLDSELMAFYSVVWQVLAGNPLWVAIERLPEVITPLHQVLARWHVSAQAFMWTQTDGLHRNALMLVIKKNSIAAVIDLCEGLTGLNDSVRKTVLSQTDCSGNNALMLMREHHPNAAFILEALYEKEPAVQKEGASPAVIGTTKKSHFSGKKN